MRTLPNMFTLDFMYYQKWSPSDSTAAKVNNTGCGELSYALVSKSWDWIGDEIISRPPGSDYFEGEKTVHIVTAKYRF